MRFLLQAMPTRYVAKKNSDCWFSLQHLLILLTSPPSWWIMPSYIVCASCLRERERRNLDVHENIYMVYDRPARKEGREGKNCNAACD